MMEKIDVRVYRLSKREMEEAESCMRSLLSESVELLDKGISRNFVSIRREAHDSSFSMVRAMHLGSRRVALFSFSEGKPHLIEYEDKERIYFICERISDKDYRFARTSRDYDWLTEDYSIRYISGSPFSEAREYCVKLSISDSHNNILEDKLLESSFSTKENAE